MNESVNDWIKRVVVSLHYPATKETSNHQLSWHWLTIKADVHILPWVHVTLCMVYIVLTFFVSIFIFRRRIGGIESQHRSSRDVITRHSYGYTSNRFVLFLKYFPQLCIKSRVIYGVLTTRPNILPRFRNQEIINIFPFFTSSFLPYGSLETGYTYNFKHRHK